VPRARLRRQCLIIQGHAPRDSAIEVVVAAPVLDARAEEKPVGADAPLIGKPTAPALTTLHGPS
jgi:hypothetical protein